MAVTDGQIVELLQKRTPEFAKEAIVFLQELIDLSVKQRILPVVDPDGADDEIDSAIVDNVPPDGWIAPEEVKWANEDMAGAIKVETVYETAATLFRMGLVALGGA